MINGALILMNELNNTVAIGGDGVVVQNPVEEIIGVAQVPAALDDGPLVILDDGVVDDVLDFGQRLSTDVAEGRPDQDRFLPVVRQLTAH